MLHHPPPSYFHPLVRGLLFTEWLLQLQASQPPTEFRGRKGDDRKLFLLEALFYLKNYSLRGCCHWQSCSCSSLAGISPGLTAWGGHNWEIKADEGEAGWEWLLGKQPTVSATSTYCVPETLYTLGIMTKILMLHRLVTHPLLTFSTKSAQSHWALETDPSAVS